MRTMLKLAVLLVVVAGGAGAWLFWTDLSPGEQHHVVDKAKRGDADGLVDTLQFKAGEAVDRQKQKAAELAKEAASAVVDEANVQLKLAVDKAAADAKAKIASAGVDAGPGTDAGR